MSKLLAEMLEYYHHINRCRYNRKINKRIKLSKDEKLKLVQKFYLQRVGHELDWDNLKTYTEKMQWAKLYDPDPKKSLLSDKYAVREWVAEKIGEQYLIPLLGAWDTFDEIDFDKLPDRFVLKTNNGSGTNLIVKDKSKFDRKKARRLVNEWLKTDFSCYNPFEFQYAAIPPKIIAEKFMVTETGDLPDYKFLCFDGAPRFCWVDMNRQTNHKRNIYDMDWNLQSWNQLNYGTYDGEVPCPECFEEMKRIATVLAQGFSHVRVDLYVIDGRIYFGEMTFTNGSGFERIHPAEADLMLGELWKVDTTKRDKGYIG